MKKKVIGATFVVFTCAFLLWPYSVPGQAGPGFQCEGMRTSYSSISADCGPPRQVRLGGGLKYIVTRAQSKPNDRSNSTNGYHFLGKEAYIDEGYFQPVTALTGSLIVSAVLAVIVIGIRRIKAVLK